jgi:hypothetical protein
LPIFGTNDELGICIVRPIGIKNEIFAARSKEKYNHLLLPVFAIYKSRRVPTKKSWVCASVLIVLMFVANILILFFRPRNIALPSFFSYYGKYFYSELMRRLRHLPNEHPTE